MTLSSIRKKVPQIFSGKPVVRAYVFGSTATGSRKKDSDLDILIELDSKSQIGLIEFIKIQIQLEELFEMKVDLVCSDGLSRHIRPFIESEKQLIYEA
jgi:predicted nucleotidyltransferase